MRARNVLVVGWNALIRVIDVLKLSHGFGYTPPNCLTMWTDELFLISFTLNQPQWILTFEATGRMVHAHLSVSHRQCANVEFRCPLRFDLGSESSIESYLEAVTFSHVLESSHGFRSDREMKISDMSNHYTYLAFCRLKDGVEGSVGVAMVIRAFIVCPIETSMSSFN